MLQTRQRASLSCVYKSAIIREESKSGQHRWHDGHFDHPDLVIIEPQWGTSKDAPCESLSRLFVEGLTKSGYWLCKSQAVYRNAICGNGPIP